jgi:hypothetical protein
LVQLLPNAANILPIEAVLWQEDADPHGVLEYVEHVPKPADWPDSPNYDDWARIFTMLPAAIIEGECESAHSLLRTHRMEKGGA